MPDAHAAKALCECAAAVVKRRGLPTGTLVGYEEIAEEAFGKFGRAVISAIIYTELFGTCALLFILEVRSMYTCEGVTGAISGGVWQQHDPHGLVPPLCANMRV